MMSQRSATAAIAATPATRNASTHSHCATMTKPFVSREPSANHAMRSEMVTPRPSPPAMNARWERGEKPRRRPSRNSFTGRSCYPLRSGRRTLRRRGQSAARLAVVTAACLTKRDAQPQVAARDDEPTRQRDVRVGEVTDGSAEVAAAVRMHLRTIGWVSEDAKRIHTPHGDLSLEEIAEMLPGTGEIMQNVGGTWWKCAYAAR